MHTATNSSQILPAIQLNDVNTIQAVSGRVYQTPGTANVFGEETGMTAGIRTLGPGPGCWQGVWAPQQLEASLTLLSPTPSGAVGGGPAPGAGVHAQLPPRPLARD